MRKNKQNDKKTYLAQTPIVIVGLDNFEFALISIIFILILFLVAFSLSKRFNKEKSSINVIEDTLDILHKAMDNRVRFDILATAKKLSQQISGYINDTQDKIIVIEVSQICDELNIEQDYKIYFRLKRGTQQDFYEFSSKLMKIEKNSALSYSLFFSTPKFIQNGQKRDFFRISPAQNLIQTIMLWLPKENLTELPTYLNELKTPNFAKSKNHKQIKLEDISSSGVRITLLSEETKELHINLFTDNIVYFIIGLKSNPESPQQIILTQSNVRRVRQSCKYGDIDIGLQFMNYAIIKSNSEIIKWYHSEANGEIPSLTNWITLLDQQNVHKLRELERTALQKQN